MNLLYLKGMLQAIIELLLGEVKVVEKLEPDPLVVVIYLPPLCGAAGRDDGFLAVSASCLLRCYFNCTCTCLITWFLCSSWCFHSINKRSRRGLRFWGQGSTVSPASHADSGPMNEVSCTCHYICYFCFQYLCLCLYLLCCWYIQAELQRPYFEEIKRASSSYRSRAYFGL